MVKLKNKITGRNRIRRLLLGITVALITVAVILFIKWKESINNGGQVREEPFRIVGNCYYIGTQNVTSFLLTGPKATC